jgi:hypothetical protein
MTLQEMIDRRDALLQARAGAVLRVEYDGKAVTYRSDADLAAALADLDRRIAGAQGSGVTEVRINYRSGLK